MTYFKIKNSFFQSFVNWQFQSVSHYMYLKKKPGIEILQIVKSGVKGKKCISFNYCLFLDSRNLWFFFILSSFYFFDGCLIHPVFATSQEEIQVVSRGWLSSIRYSNMPISISTKIIIEIEQSINREKIRREIYLSTKLNFSFVTFLFFFFFFYTGKQRLESN